MAGRVIRVCDECGSDQGIDKYALGRGAVRLTRELCRPCLRLPYETLLAHAERDADRTRRSRPQARMRLTAAEELSARQAPQKRTGGTQAQSRAARRPRGPSRA
jgi:hypothetical protein